MALFFSVHPNRYLFPFPCHLLQVKNQSNTFHIIPTYLVFSTPREKYKSKIEIWIIHKYSILFLICIAPNLVAQLTEGGILFDFWTENYYSCTLHYPLMVLLQVVSEILGFSVLLLSLSYDSEEEKEKIWLSMEYILFDIYWTLFCCLHPGPSSAILFFLRQALLSYSFDVFCNNSVTFIWGFVMKKIFPNGLFHLAFLGHWKRQDGWPHFWKRKQMFIKTKVRIQIFGFMSTLPTSLWRKEPQK